MNRKQVCLPAVLGLILLLVQLPVASTGTVVGKVLPRVGQSVINGTGITVETTLFAGDAIATQPGSEVILLLSEGPRVHLGPSSSAVVVAAEDGMGYRLTLSGGIARVVSSGTEALFLDAQGFLIRAVGPGTFEVGIDGTTVLVAGQTAGVSITTAGDSLEVPRGQMVRLESRAADATNLTGPKSAFRWTPRNAVWVAVAISVGISVPVAWYLADQLAKDACENALRQISVSVPTTGC